MNLSSEAISPSAIAVDIALPKAAEGVISVEQMEEVYKHDDRLQQTLKELALIETEEKTTGAFIAETRASLASMSRNRSMLVRKAGVLRRDIRARQKLLMQRQFDRHLMAVRKQLGFGQPRQRLDNLRD